MSAPDCAFCQIVEGEAEASFVHQDDTVVAFMDIQPLTQGHMRVAPRQHFVRMLEVPDQIAMRAFRIARMLASSSQAVLGAGGVNLIVMDGEVAFQDVPHFHIHVVPRYANDVFGLTFPDSYTSPPPRAQLQAIASAIHSAAHVTQTLPTLG